MLSPSQTEPIAWVNPEDGEFYHYRCGAELFGAIWSEIEERVHEKHEPYTGYIPWEESVPFLYQEETGLQIMSRYAIQEEENYAIQRDIEYLMGDSFALVKLIISEASDSFIEWVVEGALDHLHEEPGEKLIEQWLFENSEELDIGHVRCAACYEVIS